jgi:hypothetical protein
LKIDRKATLILRPSSFQNKSAFPGYFFLDSNPFSGIFYRSPVPIEPEAEQKPASQASLDPLSIVPEFDSPRGAKLAFAVD